MTGIVIARPDESWPAQYEKTADAVGRLLGDVAQRIDHIGSTSVPRLPAKDIIDMQVTVATEPELDDVVERMVAGGLGAPSAATRPPRARPTHR
ncbi:GrpB family protein [Kribbella sp. NPDC026611]|uniref:GrpB family protein n=1 Tax=Kribbella sp. NPDC026611 TaxID=3154911 RepID=UPI00340D74DA